MMVSLGLPGATTVCLCDTTQGEAHNIVLAVAFFAACRLLLAHSMAVLQDRFVAFSGSNTFTFYYAQ